MDNICIDCLNSADCKHKPTANQWTVAGCPLFVGDAAVITNADRIRSMSDEELAAEIVKCRDADDFRKTVLGTRMNTTEEWLDWLKSPVEGKLPKEKTNADKFIEVFPGVDSLDKLVDVVNFGNRNGLVQSGWWREPYKEVDE